jgi:SAM-dependent methyltransferase
VIDLRQLLDCLVCRSINFELLYESTFTGTKEEAPAYFLNTRSLLAHGRITRCRGCGFCWTNPQFDVDEYEHIYACIQRLSPTANPLFDAETVRFDRLVKLVSSYSAKPRRLLDLGCGDGKFLAAMPAEERFGYEVAGVHSSYPDGIQVITDDLLAKIGEAPLLEGTFDVLTAWDVFEHLPDLDQFVVAIGRLLCSGGYLFVTVPNLDSLVARLCGERWSMILLEHLWYFGPKTLDLFLGRHGFSMVKQGHMPFAVTASYLAARFAQTYGLKPSPLPKLIGKKIISVPIGLMYGVYQRQ